MFSWALDYRSRVGQLTDLRNANANNITRSESHFFGHDRQTYVICLDCGTELGYDLATMRIARPLSSSAPMTMPQASAETEGPGA